MQLTRIFGLHGTGKSTKIYEYLEECVKSKKQAFLIVPEQSALAAERTLIEKLGNPANMYVEVINFKRLCNRVFREVGGIVSNVPDDVTKQLAMNKALEEVSDFLKEYRLLASDTDFAEKMLSMAERMQTAAIKPDDLEKVIKNLPESLGGKLHDILLAYKAYHAYLENKLDFPGDLLDKLYEVLCETDFFAGKDVFIDSFYGFTGQELDIIGKIITSADNTYITFLCQGEDHKDKSFSRGTNGAKECRRMAENSAIPVKDITLEATDKYKSKAIDSISKHFSLSALSEDSTYDRSGLEIIRCEDLNAEAECALKIVSDLLSSGARPGEIAICAASVDEYEGILDSLFKKAEIPLAFDSRTSLSTTPLSALVCAAFDIYFTWSKQSVTEYIKTGISGLDDTSADILELYMNTWNINGKQYYNSTWYMNPEGFVEDEPNSALLEEINNSRSKIMSCIMPFCDSLDKSKTASDIAKAVYNLTKSIAKLGGTSLLDDGENGKQTDMLFGLLDSMYNTLGDELMSPARFRDLFTAGVGSVTTGKLPELIDEVRFSGVALMRNHGIKYVIILGVNDGIFPGGKSSSDMFRDAEKKLLKEYGIDLADTDEDKAYDDLFLAYTALCSATDRAFVLYRKADASGKTLYKSVIVNILQKMFSIEKPTEYKPGSILDYAINDEILFENYMTLPEGTEKATLREYFLQNESYSKRIQTASLEDRTNTPLGTELLSEMYGERMSSSYSRIERFKECPFKYFLTYTLKLKPEPIARLGSLETGNTVHKVLEELIPEFAELCQTQTEIPASTVKEMVSQKLAQMLEVFMHGKGDEMSRRFKYMFKRLENSLNSLCLEIVKELEVSKFKPTDFELKLSYDGEVPPLTTDMPDGRKLAIIGAIDRVDVYKDEASGETWIRITDYKTGSKEFKTEDAREGFNLQMLLYLYAITGKSGGKYKNAKPAGVIYRMVTPPADDSGKFKTVTDESFIENESVSSISGLVVQDENIIYAMDPGFEKTGRFSPVKETKNGIKGALPFDELVTLLEDAVSKAADLAAGIASGNKSATPYKSKTRDACNFCDYKRMCRYKEN